ncbi:class I SAM-dependent methyltransferase [Tepidiphilus olei]|uniref:class I SAM-dependent methyltransferase n=1 Tax=Tepidiphilus olei TaxID=2502184 RepID=UPI00115D8C47|nr:class I SAM-dependent methyltransferase [Tepidiphilus olei]
MKIPGKQEYSSLKKAQSIVGFSKTRDAMDNYPTPGIAVEALLERESFDGTVWEPACGSGNIARYFPGCIATDIRYDNIYGEKGVDFLKEWRTVDHIITNPPYRLAQEFVEHALECARKKVAMLCKLAFLEGKSRYEMFKNHPLKKVYVFSNRLPLTKESETRKQSSMIPFAWFVWDKDYSGQTSIDWILIPNKKIR